MTDKPDSPLARSFIRSPNFGDRRDGRRPDILLLHYTGMESADAALDWLVNPQSSVSCHYLVDEAGVITQMVAEDKRAWHAGASCWAGETDINSSSIGIEIHNPGHDFEYPPFPEAQMQAVEALCLDILGRHDIPARRVLAHSDVAPERKIDPGEKFDWKRLAEAGAGLWVPPGPPGSGEGLGPGSGGGAVKALQEKLRAYGYEVEATGEYDDRTYVTVAAFQRHFRPDRIDGIADLSTVATLDKLLDKIATPVG
ncbi:MAG: N-acetylmuramoyl-L-alanine amidase [Hyphomicrobiales bacterium]